MKVIDEDLLYEFRCKERCEFCNAKSLFVRPHHVYARGMGGGNRLDVKENLIGLCPHCHDLAHAGFIARGTILDVIANREGSTRNVLIDTIHRLQREPKRANEPQAGKGTGGEARDSSPPP